jgi:alpha-tubulin suppressor-like RCC1 family protein
VRSIYHPGIRATDAGAPAFTVQPTNTTVDSSIVPAVVVTVEDASGDPVTAATTQVSLSINGTDSDADLIGTPTVDASSGVATFPYLSVNRPRTGYTLTASATGLTSATSAAFNVDLITTGPFTQVNIGANSACAVTTGGTGYCWGNNSNGQLGNGTFVASANPAAVTGNLTFGALSVGEGGHACGIAGGGAAYCWGYNASGQLGVSSVAYTNSPVAVSGGLAFASISTGENAQTCGVTAAGAGYCWGFNGDGELGNGTTTNSSTPVAVGGNHTYSSLSVGDAFACGVATGGTVYCWGYGSQGQLGTGAIAASSAPIAIFGGLTYSSVSAGYASACAVTTGGAAYCWGNNSFGQLGNRSITATLVPALVVTPP